MFALCVWKTNQIFYFCNCGHLIVCGDCYHELENDKCPKCRKVNLIIRKM